MQVEEIRQRVKEIIANVTSIQPDEIADDASFIDDLGLDSLTLLEIGVNVDYEYKLGVSDEELQELKTLQDAVDLARTRLAERPVEVA